MDLKARAKKLKSDIPALFLSLKDKDTPVIAKIFIGVAVVYALSPIDLIPDFIPVLGYLDDVLLLPMLIAVAIKLIPEEVFKKNKEKAKECWENDNARKWYYAIPIIIIWFFIILLVVKSVI